MPHQAVQPQGRRQRLIKLLWPSGSAMRRVYLMLGMVSLLITCMLLLVVIADQESPACRNDIKTCLTSVTFVTTLGVLPVALALLASAAYVEKRSAPRALLWLAATGAIGLAGLILAWVFGLQEGATFEILAFLCLAGVAPLMLIFSIPAVYLGAQAAPELRAALQEDLAERALFTIQARGEIPLERLASDLGISAPDTHALVEQLLSSGRLPGTLDAPRRWVYSAAGLAARQRSLLEIVHRAGQIDLDGLVSALGGPEPAPEAVVVDWIYQLVQRGQFGGYINWAERVLYAAEARQIGANSQCPHCGGKLGMAPLEGATALQAAQETRGRLAIRCQHCGVEILQMPASPPPVTLP